MADNGQFFTLKEVFQGEEIEAIYRVARKPVDNQEEIDLSQAEDPMARMGQGFCPAFNQRTYEAAPGIICHQDVEVVLRDGCKIYTDIFMPKNLKETWRWNERVADHGCSATHSF